MTFPEPQRNLRYTFGRAQKLHLQKDFQKILRSGQRLKHSCLVVFVYNRSDSSSLPRLGLITSRKLGNAVVRNRLKRRLREIFRLNKNHIKQGVDILFLPKPDALALNYKQLESVVISIFKRARIFFET